MTQSPAEKAEEKSQDHAIEPNMNATFRSSYKTGYLAGYTQGQSDERKRAEVLLEALRWYASHDLEMTSEYARSGIWRRAKMALAEYEKVKT